MSSRQAYVLLTKVRVGDRLQYNAGMGDYHVEAIVEVDSTPGTTGVYVKILEIQHPAPALDYKVGDVIIAGALEISPIDTESV